VIETSCSGGVWRVEQLDFESVKHLGASDLSRQVTSFRSKETKSQKIASWDGWEPALRQTPTDP